jgi:hypothetical protein
VGNHGIEHFRKLVTPGSMSLCAQEQQVVDLRRKTFIGGRSSLSC